MFQSFYIIFISINIEKYLNIDQYWLLFKYKPMWRIWTNIDQYSNISEKVKYWLILKNIRILTNIQISTNIDEYYRILTNIQVYIDERWGIFNYSWISEYRKYHVPTEIILMLRLSLRNQSSCEVWKYWMLCKTL